jgi:GT2 family glycosyltransferase
MSKGVAQGQGRKAAPPVAEAVHPAGIFPEETYLRLNPDVLMAVSAGKFRSGWEHYEHFGRSEGRPVMPPSVMPWDKIVPTAALDKAATPVSAPAGAIDAICLSNAGGIYIVGWVNDAQDRLQCIELNFPGWSVIFSGANLARLRRPDADAALGLGPAHMLGFWSFLYGARRLSGGLCNLVLRFKSGAELQVTTTADIIDDREMRNMLLTQLATVQYLGNAYFDSYNAIDPAIGAQLVDFNRVLTRRAVSAPYVKRFGRADAVYKGSIIVCLYGKPEYLFLQQALFSAASGMRDYEFIYVSNSPEIAEQLLKEAELCEMIYGLDLTLVLLNGNAGFGAANNIAADYARSNRLLIVNPDVFPRDPAWAEKHNAVLETLPAVQTDLFGAPLYYDDGSLMHGGMYFEFDTMPGFAQGQIKETSILRVEHYGKGAPPDTASFLRPRPVPAVTGAFISASRSWFEELGGFNEDYIFGHYEDADLCLKSLAAGRAAWLHDIRLWHLEGKGSIRQPPHEGGSIVNRWLFTRNWSEQVRDGLLGPVPGHEAFKAGLVP